MGKVLHSEYYDSDIDHQHPLASESCWDSVRFEQCRFEGLDLSDGQWRFCVFDECEFIDCDFSLLSLNNSQLHSAVFQNCKLLGVDWTHADWASNLGNPLHFKNCILNSGSFFGLALGAIQLINCKVHDVDFTEASLVKARFVGTELDYSRFHNTDLTSADFTQAQGYQIDVRQNRVDKARFSRIEALGLLVAIGIELVD